MHNRLNLITSGLNLGTSGLFLVTTRLFRGTQGLFRRATRPCRTATASVPGRDWFVPPGKSTGSVTRRAGSGGQRVRSLEQERLGSGTPGLRGGTKRMEWGTGAASASHPVRGQNNHN